jgi:hypothetical protein
MVLVVPLGVGGKFTPGGRAETEPVKIEIRIADPLVLPEVART